MGTLCCSLDKGNTFTLEEVIQCFGAFWKILSNNSKVILYNSALLPSHCNEFSQNCRTAVCWPTLNYYVYFKVHYISWPSDLNIFSWFEGIYDATVLPCLSNLGILRFHSHFTMCRVSSSSQKSYFSFPWFLNLGQLGTFFCCKETCILGIWQVWLGIVSPERDKLVLCTSFLSPPIWLLRNADKANPVLEVKLYVVH